MTLAGAARRPAVVKFGGSAFRTPEAYGLLARALSDRIAADGRRLIVVAGARPGETEALRERLYAVHPHPADALGAGLLTLAETISAQLLAAALQRAGRSSTVLAGHRIGLTTTSTFLRARLENIDPGPPADALAEYETVVVPGGQAVDAELRPTSLGRNSADLTAVAMAAAVGADRCEIHSGVDGVRSADPRLVAGTRLLPDLSYATAALMSLHGAAVLHRRAVRLAGQHRITIVHRLNRAPFPVGTTVGETGAEAAAVIVNRRSVVLRYTDDAAADRAHLTFGSEGVDTVRLEDGPRVAVIGGHPDLDGFRTRHGLPPAHRDGVPVTEVSGGRALVHVAPDEAGAVRLAQELHEPLTAGNGPRLTSVRPHRRE
ncbi:aspartate kinase [Streptomyces sp. CAU 1734]|uniref:amino acid kinase family protein n=1 Tax=Streptomyces sp. CAU 1734 TaxID=3140360 RepID=UPI003260EDA0